MNQFKTELYDNVFPPFACCLFSTQIHPKNQNFLGMLRCTFVPYFQLYSFTFFWILTNTFVFIYSQSRTVERASEQPRDQFMRVPQWILFQLGENYPYFIVKNYHYYRLIISLVLSRNLYHYIMATLGAAMFGSYVEQIVGFKRTLLLTVSSGVGAQLIRNVFQRTASLQTLTPVCGLLGFMLAYFLVKYSNEWKYLSKEKFYMLLVMVFFLGLYIELGITYRNISVFSMLFCFVIGFVFFFTDGPEEFLALRVPSIVFLCTLFGLFAFLFFFRSQPQRIEI